MSTNTWLLGPFQSRDLPSGWKVSKFGVELEESRERNGDAPPGPLLSVSEYRGVELNERKDGQQPSLDVSHYRVVRPNQLAVNMMWLNHGGLGVSELTGYVSPAYKVFRLSRNLLPRYVHHLLRSSVYVDYFAAIGKGVRPNSQMVTTIEWEMTPIPLPDLPTQRRIADYLDRETGEIDAILAKLDEMAETLDQRRNDAIAQAIASHQTAPIGLLAEVTLGKMLQTRPQSPDDKPVPYMRAAHVQPKGMLDLAVQPHEMWTSTQDLERLTLRAGDCVVVEGGVGGYGRAAFVNEDIDGWVFQNSIIRLRAESPWVGKYLAYALVLARRRGEIEAACSAVAMPHFTAEKVEKFRVPYHSPAEQRRIAEHLDEVTGRIDAMLEKVAKLKELLTERRAALITEVVTGRKEV